LFPCIFFPQETESRLQYIPIALHVIVMVIFAAARIFNIFIINVYILSDAACFTSRIIYLPKFFVKIYSDMLTRMLDNDIDMNSINLDI
jgi:hypothetical protein